MWKVEESSGNEGQEVYASRSLSILKVVSVIIGSTWRVFLYFCKIKSGKNERKKKR